ncbi:hypothetical protein SKAU_G00308810 [Synaphobranchus kaupii]|uniref:Uncharacterized protein n=1 Tax=Synaphobranchus kaupii TaxID=118154 RepID=A0A9Q1ERD8_SYNKA|nr:hypothetical protein SKAU_G00308810 [Synaphobranchus kaupii]
MTEPERGQSSVSVCDGLGFLLLNSTAFPRPRPERREQPRMSVELARCRCGQCLGRGNPPGGFKGAAASGRTAPASFQPLPRQSLSPSHPPALD